MQEYNTSLTNDDNAYKGKGGEVSDKLNLSRTNDISTATWMTIVQTQQYCQCSRQGACELARQAGALVDFLNRKRVHRPTLDSYLLRECVEKAGK